MTASRPSPWWIVPLAAVAIAATDGDLRLVDAVKKADAAATRTLLNQRVDVNARQGDGATALHWAAYRNDLQTAELLIRAGAKVDLQNDLGATPLWVASRQGSGTVVAALLKAGASPNIALESGETPLMAAARTNSADSVKALLEYGASPNAREHSRNQTALMWAVAQQHPENVAALVSAGADIHARSTVWPLIENFGGDGNNALTSANPPDPRKVDEGGYTPLLFAARNGAVSSARILLDAGANPNDTTASNLSALVIAAHSGQGEMAALLLERGANPNVAGTGYTALHAAILKNDPTLVKALLKQGADPNAAVVNNTPGRRNSQDAKLDKTMVGASPLWLAARFAQPDSMRVLAQAGADARFAKDGTTVIMAALTPTRGGGGRGNDGQERTTLDAVKLAVEFGADVNAVNDTGDTALHYAAGRALNQVIEFLVEKGARLDAENYNGETPLAIASAATPSRASATAGQLARENAGRSSTAELLRKLGAKE